MHMKEPAKAAEERPSITIISARGFLSKGEGTMDVDGGDERSDDNIGVIKQHFGSIGGCMNNNRKPSCQQGDAGM